MAFWIEVQCSDTTSPDCLSNKNRGPVRLSYDTDKAIRKTINDLKREALEQGWRMRGYRLICPECAK